MSEDRVRINSGNDLIDAMEIVLARRNVSWDAMRECRISGGGVVLRARHSIEPEMSALAEIRSAINVQDV